MNDNIGDNFRFIICDHTGRGGMNSIDAMKVDQPETKVFCAN